MKGLVRHVAPVAPGEATGILADVYAQVRREFQLSPPFTLHSPAPRVLAGAWGVVRESQIVPGLLGRTTKEAISASVSKINACPYCVDAHTGLLAGADDAAIGSAIRAGTFEHIADGRPRDLAAWASATRRPGDPVLRSPPFTREEAPEAIGTALAYHYVNRMVHVFLGDGLLPGPAPLRAIARGVFGATFAKRIVRRGGDPGASLGLLPDAPLPAGFGWARPNPSVAGAWARFSGVIDEIGHRMVPAHVVAVLDTALDGWHGDDPGLSSSWLDAALSDVPSTERSMGKHVLQTALSSYRIDDAEVTALRESLGGDTALVELTAWAAFIATRRIATWIAPS